MGKVLPSQRLLKQFEERLVFGDMNLSEIVRSGAQMMGMSRRMLNFG